MILTKLNYRENEGRDTYWEINNLNFGMLNLIVGLNATGKTRLVNLISNLAKILSKKIQTYKDGYWDLEFKSEKEKYKYKLKIEKREIVYEEIIKGQKILLKREYEGGKIYSHTLSKKISISPPKTELVVHVRRDVKEFPFLEDIFKWANNFLGYGFTSERPDIMYVPIGGNQVDMLENLGKTPYLLQKALKKDEKIVSSIIKDFTSIGYPISKINVKSILVSGFQNPALITSVKEIDLKCEIDQGIMSQGMYRALSLIVILNYLLKIKKQCTIVIDDLGEGLDFQRSSELTKLLVDKLEGTNIQMIMTSNDRFLINSVNLKHVNLLERVGPIVKAYNYQNNRKVFDEFKYTGLNNFDLFSGRMYKIEEK